MATGSTREARRRRILEGGSDRLALITGRPPAPSSTSQDSDFAANSPPYTSDNPNFVSSVHRNEEEKPSTFTMPKSYQAAKFSQIDTSVSGIIEEFLHEAETNNVPLKPPASEAGARQEYSRMVHGPPNPAPDVQDHSAQKMHLHDLFTYQLITSAVATTEQIRLLCSLTMAFMVVLSYVGFPIISSWLIRIIIQFCPLFLVLMTNITLILRHLITAKLKDIERVGKEASKSPLTNEGYYGWAEEAGKIVEMALMAHSVIGALFMDCSVYAVIVICGLSLA